MEIRFDMIGDPWHDWGLCELYHVLRSLEESGQDVEVSEYDDSGFTVSTKLDSARFGKLIAQSIGSVDRWNELHPRYEEAKKIERCKPLIKDGRRVPGVKYEPKVTKEEWESSGCKGEPPNDVRNSVLRLPSIPMTPKLLEPYFDQHDSPNSGLFQYSGKLIDDELAQITQSINPLVAKHHSNANARGFAGSNGYPKDTAKYSLVCLCASLSPRIPFVKTSGSDAVVLLPECNSFTKLIKLRKLIDSHGLLRHPDDPDGTMRTNLKFFAEGRNAQLLILLNSLQDDWVLIDVDDLFTAEEVRTFTNWITIEIGSGTNVRIGAIKSIKVPSEIFDLLKPIAKPDWFRSPDDYVSFVKDCFAHLYFNLYPAQDKLAAALFKYRVNSPQCWEELSDTAFQMYKNIDNAKVTRVTAGLLQHFYLHFAKEITSMTEEQIQSCKKLGELAGSAFSNDVTLLSRLHNTSSPNDFRENIELLAFRLFKLSKGGDANNAWHLSADEVYELLKMADTPDWKQAATTISTFASLKAFNQNL